MMVGALWRHSLETLKRERFNAVLVLVSKRQQKFQFAEALLWAQSTAALRSTPAGARVGRLHAVQQRSVGGGGVSGQDGDKSG